jgi:hypothetical protein
MHGPTVISFFLVNSILKDLFYQKQTVYNNLKTFICVWPMPGSATFIGRPHASPLSGAWANCNFVLLVQFYPQISIYQKWTVYINLNTFICEWPMPGSAT